MSANSESSPETGAIELLMKAAAHPSLTICSLALSSLTQLLALVPALAAELLRVLQRRAIWPHGLQGDLVVIEGTNVHDESQCDFGMFRETALRDALVACFKAQRSNYLNSCASAVEEFCTKDTSERFILPLEAALYCLEVVAEDVMVRDDPWENDRHMNRLLSVLEPQPTILVGSSIGRERLCSFLCSVSCAVISNLPILTVNLACCTHRSTLAGLQQMAKWK